MTPSCFSFQSSSIIAYASFCQTDGHGRPIAGYINFCPVWLRGSSGMDEDRTALVTLHELIHTLGFSKDLWHEFRDCSHTCLVIYHDLYCIHHSP